MEPGRSRSDGQSVWGSATRALHAWRTVTRTRTETFGAALMLFTMVGLRSTRPIYMVAITTIAVGRALVGYGATMASRVADTIAGV